MLDVNIVHKSNLLNFVTRFLQNLIPKSSMRETSPCVVAEEIFYTLVEVV